MARETRAAGRDAMTGSGLLARVRAGDEAAFGEITDPYRPELLVHCYRILGSLQDAEDVLQETLISAWRGIPGFEERGSLRSWLYRIATHRCLNWRRDEARRPQGHRALAFDPPEPTRLGEVTWLEPFPDSLLDALPDAAPGPEARYETREAVGLAFVTALQRLPARQRAALVLRDVLGLRAAEAAAVLETSEATITSALQRARAALETRSSLARERAPAPGSVRERKVADRFAEAFEAGDVEGVVALLTDDAWVTMPPEPFEYQGREAIARFLAHLTALRARRGRETRLVPTRASGQPAFGHYFRDAGGPEAHASGLLVLTLAGDRISAIARFAGDELVPRFGLPATVPG